jgi:hypothetical protein
MRRQRWIPAPADVVLELLCIQRIPYRCHAQLGRWDTKCPLCAASHVIREHRERGRNSLHCESGSDPAKELDRLKHPECCPACGTNTGHVAQLGRVVGELLELANAQQSLLRETIASDADDAGLRIAA